MSSTAVPEKRPNRCRRAPAYFRCGGQRPAGGDHRVFQGGGGAYGGGLPVPEGGLPSAAKSSGMLRLAAASARASVSTKGHPQPLGRGGGPRWIYRFPAFQSVRYSFISPRKPYSCPKSACRRRAGSARGARRPCRGRRGRRRVQEKRYSQLRPGMGRDSSFIRFRPWTVKEVRISCREPLWWGRVKSALILSRPPSAPLPGRPPRSGWCSLRCGSPSPPESQARRAGRPAWSR